MCVYREKKRVGKKAWITVYIGKRRDCVKSTNYFVHREKKRLGKKSAGYNVYRANTGVGKKSDDYHVYREKKEMDTKNS